MSIMTAVPLPHTDYTPEREYSCHDCASFLAGYDTPALHFRIRAFIGRLRIGSRFGKVDKDLDEGFIFTQRGESERSVGKVEAR